MLLAFGGALTGCSGGGMSPIVPQHESEQTQSRVSRFPVHYAFPTTAPSPAASPLPSPSATPQAVATKAASSIIYPVYSSYFKGKTPFHDTVAQLMAAGAQVLSPKIAANFWAEGVAGNVDPASTTSGNGPMYAVKPGDPSYTFACAAYGACDASGATVHYPSDAAPAPGSDHHLVSFDPTYRQGEVDGWGCSPIGTADSTPGTASCAWGGNYPFSGSGLSTDWSGANAGGYAYGLMNVSAQELLNGHIDHALGIISSCLDDGGVYPATTGKASDSHCPANLEPNASYGDMIHLKSNVNVALLGYSPFCAEIVQALQTYGAYTADNNGGGGLSLEFEYPKNPAYTTDPWFSTILPSMTAGGDGTGSGSSFRYQTCLQRIPASDIEVIQISQNLP